MTQEVLLEFECQGEEFTELNTANSLKSNKSCIVTLLEKLLPIESPIDFSHQVILSKQ